MFFFSYSIISNIPESNYCIYLACYELLGLDNGIESLEKNSAMF